MTCLLYGLNDEHPSGGQIVHFKNTLAFVTVNLEELVLAQGDAVVCLAKVIHKRRNQLRPGRSYPRKSRKPV